MSQLDSLKIKEGCAIVAPTSAAHNALVALIENMVGSGGVKVTVSEGRILIELSGTNLPKGGSGSSGGTNLVTSVAGKTGAVTLVQADITGLKTSDSPTFAGITIGSATYTDQTLTVCVGGVTKTMHVLGTTPV